ncbi:MAG: DUF456 domain-containing protein [Caldilineaceae bacterium]|nr:DUF456 domain-containing protein [Caldilineaceae bacterium]
MTVTTMTMILGFILVGLGFIGVIVPLLPGLTLIWLGVFVWAWGDGFQQVAWPTLTVLGLLTLVGIATDWLMAPAMSRRAGVSWRAIGGAIVGGVLGGIFLSPIPILGTLAGALIGAVAGMWYVEYRIRDDSDAATAAVFAYLRGVAASTLLNLVLACVMVAIFLWRVMGT